MATVTLHGNAVQVAGKMPAVGEQAPAFTLTDKALGDATLASFAGKRKVPELTKGIHHQGSALVQIRAH